MSPYELFIGLRYTRAKRRNHFISFISLISLLGITLGMTALITVMSVMNGFQKEVRTRILGVASHIQISGIDGKLTNWRQVAHEALQNPQVEAAAPYVSAQGMVSFDQVVRGVVVRGILPDMENNVADLARMMVDGELDNLVPGRFGIIVGRELARVRGLAGADGVDRLLRGPIRDVRGHGDEVLHRDSFRMAGAGPGPRRQARPIGPRRPEERAWSG